MIHTLESTVLKTVVLFLLVVVFISCEGYRLANGNVKDQVSNLPLDSVYVHVVNRSDTMYTDTSGTFKVHGEFGSCMSGCKDIVIKFSKDGYKMQTLKNPQAGITVFMERE